MDKTVYMEKRITGIAIQMYTYAFNKFIHNDYKKVATDENIKD